MTPTAITLLCATALLLFSNCNVVVVVAEINLAELDMGTTVSVPLEAIHPPSFNDAGVHSASEAVARKMVKRAPNGFLGMRGKKDYEEIANNDWSDPGPNPLEQDYNDNNDIYDYIRYKKTPNAFVGVRGKKYTTNDMNRLGQLVQRLEEDRLRENLLQDFINRLTLHSVDSNEILAKRVPMGFTGMRGKRPIGDDGEASLLGFEDQTDNSHEEISKRAPVNAFLGVRGKKDVSHQNYKRSASQAFDTRGRNQRFTDFSNKFVAVRGKKSGDNGNGEYNNGGGLDEDEEEQDSNNAADRMNYIGGLRYLVHYPDSGIWHKRAPNGFVGMRGKRPEPNLSLLN